MMLDDWEKRKYADKGKDVDALVKVDRYREVFDPTSQSLTGQQ